MPLASVCEPPKSVGVLLDSTLEGGADGCVVEGAGVVDDDGLAFSVAAGFAAFADFGCGFGWAFGCGFGWGFCGGFGCGGFAAAFLGPGFGAGFFAADLGFATAAAFFAAGFGEGFFAAGFFA